MGVLNVLSIVVVFPMFQCNAIDQNRLPAQKAGDTEKTPQPQGKAKAKARGRKAKKNAT